MFQKYLINDFFSEITKEQSSKKGVVPRSYIDSSEDEAFPKTDYYETEGIFCSFNCCYSYILQRKRDIRYRLSLGLLSKIYFDLFNKNLEIVSAPNWQLLENFGGNLTIDDFRDNFSKIEYIDMGNTTKKPVYSKFLPVNNIYEEKIKF